MTKTVFARRKYFLADSNQSLTEFIMVDRPIGLTSLSREDLWKVRRADYYQLIDFLLLGSHSVLIYDEELMSHSKATISRAEGGQISADPGLLQLSDPLTMATGSLRISSVGLWQRSSWPDPMYMTGFLAGLPQDPEISVDFVRSELVNHGESWARKAFWQIANHRLSGSELASLFSLAEFMVFVVGLRAPGMSDLHIVIKGLGHTEEELLNYLQSSLKATEVNYGLEFRDRMLEGFSKNVSSER